MVAIVGFRYRPGVEAALGEAGRLGVPSVAVLLGEDVVGPARLFVDPADGARQAEFRASLLETGDARAVSEPRELFRAVRDGVREAIPPRAAESRYPWRMPKHRDPFIGREDLLDELGCGHGARVPVGEAGTGKSRLAAEYARRRRDRYDVAWWVPCSTPEAAWLALADLASALDLEPAALPHHLSRSPGAVLLVLDDLADPAVLEPFAQARCDVLVTTRHGGRFPDHAEVEVGRFTPDEAAELLVRMTSWPPGEARKVA